MGRRKNRYRCNKCGHAKHARAFKTVVRKDGRRSRLHTCRVCQRLRLAASKVRDPLYMRKRADIMVQRRRELSSQIRKLKKQPCMDCNKKFPHYVMEWDHREGSTKVASVSNMVYKCRPIDKILEEIAKCDLVCCLCHRLRTGKRNNWDDQEES